MSSKKLSDKIENFNFWKWLKKEWKVLLLLAFFVFAAYANSLENGFVSDDRGYFAFQNLKIGSLQYLPFFDLRGFLSIIFIKTFGLYPLPLRLINLFSHLGSTLLIYLLLFQLFRKYIAIFAALIFAVHPIFIESIVWISGGSYAVYSFFFLLSFVLYIFSSKSEKLYFLSLISFWLCLSASEKSVVLFLVFYLYEFCFGNLKKNKFKLITYAFLSIFYFIYFVFILGRIESRVNSLQESSGPLTFTNPLVQIPIAITTYLQLIFWPDKLTLYHSEEIISGQLEYITRLIIFLLSIFLSIFLYKKGRRIFFWLMFFLITLLPTLTPFGISWIVAERYVYLGTLGIIVLTAIGLDKLAKVRKIKTYVYVFSAIIIIALTTRTIIRNVDWQNEDNLWIATAKTSPSYVNTHNNVGNVYFRQNNFEKAAEEFKKAIQIKPNYAYSYHNLGTAFSNLGKKNEAIENFNKALKLKPSLWQSHLEIADIYLSQKKYKIAIEEIEKAIKINPQEVSLINNLGIIYLKAGEKQKAREIFTKVLSVDPSNQWANEGLIEASK